MLSKKSKYGLKALLVLGQEAGHGPVLVSNISQREAIPLKFLEAILLELKRHGIVESKKGKGGGALPAPPPGRHYLRRSHSRAGWAARRRVVCQPDGVYDVRGMHR